MKDYYQLELDDMVIALTIKDAEIELLQKKLDIAVKALDFYKKDVCGEPYISSIAKKALKEIDLVGTSAKEEG